MICIITVSILCSDVVMFTCTRRPGDVAYESVVLYISSVCCSKVDAPEQILAEVHDENTCSWQSR